MIVGQVQNRYSRGASLPVGFGWGCSCEFPDSDPHFRNERWADNPKKCSISRSSLERHRFPAPPTLSSHQRNFSNRSRDSPSPLHHISPGRIYCHRYTRQERRPAHLPYRIRFLAASDRIRLTWHPTSGELDQSGAVRISGYGRFRIRHEYLVAYFVDTLLCRAS
jgi:hypothetical protein